MKKNNLIKLLNKNLSLKSSKFFLNFVLKNVKFFKIHFTFIY